MSQDIYMMLLVTIGGVGSSDVSETRVLTVERVAGLTAPRW